jgi:hypothetical protein
VTAGLVTLRHKHVHPNVHGSRSFLRRGDLMHGNGTNRVCAHHGFLRVAAEEREHRHAFGKRRFKGRVITQVQHEVHAEGSAGQLADAPDVGHYLFGAAVEAAEHAKRAGITHGGHQFRAGVQAGHAGLDNWVLDSKQVAGTGVDLIVRH